MKSGLAVGEGRPMADSIDLCFFKLLTKNKVGPITWVELSLHMEAKYCQLCALEGCRDTNQGRYYKNLEKCVGTAFCNQTAHTV